MDIKKFIKLIVIFCIFYFIRYVEYIPIYLFNMDAHNLSEVEKTFLSLFANLCLLLILLTIYKKDIVKYYNKLKGKHLYTFDASLKYYLLGIFLMVVTNLAVTLIFNADGSANEKMVESMIDSSPILMLINAGLVAPITEELVFRKAFMDSFPDKDLFVISSALIFGLMHVVTSATSIGTFMYFIPYSMLGLSFALMDKEQNNVLPSIFFHMMHNSVLVILAMAI